MGNVLSKDVSCIWESRVPSLCVPSRGSVRQILRGWLPEVDVERDGDVARSVRKFMYDEPNARAVRDGVLNSPTLTNNSIRSER